MTNELSTDQRVALLVAPDAERLTYFVEKVKESKEVWSLSNEEGYVMVETDDGDCVMVWPDAEFAAEWAVDEWDDCEPVGIALEEFQSTWIPSLEKDEITLAVFPNIEDEGRLTSASELKVLLEG
ncbi:DUF2750 domain-containing protein [Marinomonas mediterranea]|uniref:DUF2750 domain-containing protein n=1 Tax=Marinomonas mediterranea TaxID=119864 RepID=UPI00234ACEAE|nr:DUF2750 domain-containing protein [Marinomonas mediterranea]WCN14365.1 DUF2750 domain-containing protein [Marinomonas mediterranea]